MAVINETSDLPDFFNDATPIQEGDTFNGTLSSASDTDWIPVQLFADRSYVIEMLNDMGRPSLAVVDETGTDLTGPQSSVSGDTQNVVTVPTDGVYYIVASSSGSSEGAYTITVRSEIGDNQNTSTSLDFDLTQSPIATFESTFDHAKDTDYIEVQLETGYTYQIIALTNDGNTRFGIVDEEDNSIDRDYGNDALGFTVDEAGTYFITATNDINRPRPSPAEDQYRLTFDIEPPANSNTAYILSPGDTIAEKYDGFGDLDWYGVRMVAGHSYLVVTEAGNVQDIYFVEADGDRVGETSFNMARGQFQAVTPQMTGDYFIEVTPSSPAYRISLLQEVAGDVSTASRVALSKTETSGFEFFRDTDVFALDVIEGATYTAVATLEETSTLSFQMDVIDMDGIETRSSSDSDRVELTFTAPATGSMYIELNSSGTMAPSNLYDLFVTRDSFGANLISGTPDDDRLNDTPGNDAFDGRGGRDAVVYASDSSNYTVSLRPNGDVTVLDRNGNGDFDVLVNIEEIVFTDTTIDLTNFSSASQLTSAEMIDLAKVYAAYFNRAPDAEGLFFWADKLAEGMPLVTIAEFFFDQDETRALYPNPSDTDAFVTSIYGNVLGRTPDGAGFDFWKEQLSLGNVTQGSFVLEVIRGAQGPDIDYLQNKAEIGVYFSALGGLSDVPDAISVFNTFGNSDQADVAAAVEAANADIADALSPAGSELLFRVIDVVDDPFAIA